VDISVLVLVIHTVGEDIHMQPHNLRINVDKMIGAAGDIGDYARLRTPRRAVIESN
jgi:hypothetical protein